MFVKNEKELENLKQAVKIYTNDIGMEFGMEKSTMLIMRNEKRQMTEGIELPTPKIKNLNSRRKENLQILGTIGSGHNQKCRDKR